MSDGSLLPAYASSWIAERYPGWKAEQCWNCGGHGVVSVYSHNDFEGAGECATCGGSGTLWRSPKRRLAMYPGGPFRGS